MHREVISARDDFVTCRCRRETAFCAGEEVGGFLLDLAIGRRSSQRKLTGPFSLPAVLRGAGRVIVVVTAGGGRHDSRVYFLLVLARVVRMKVRIIDFLVFSWWCGTRRWAGLSVREGAINSPRDHETALLKTEVALPSCAATTKDREKWMLYKV